MKRELLRIIDANLNRSREGLRVCEDIARFALNSRKLTDDLKRVRHGISAVAKALSGSPDLFEARDAEGDIGKSPKCRFGTRRHSLMDVWLANMERVKESLRVLEELLRLVNPRYSATIARTRFRVYDIEKKAIKKINPLRHIG